MEPYYQEDGITLYCGDCLELIPLFTAGYFGCLVTDPPYFLPATHYQTRKQFSRNFSDLGILESFFKRFFSEVCSKISIDGSGYLFCDGQSYPLFYYHAYSFSKSLRPLIWDKQTSINGYGWRHQHEIILWFECREAKPIPTGDGDILRCRAVPVDNREHGAEKPVEILSALIKKTNGGVILDPFCGSGTTLLAAKQLGRKAVGIEISEKYCEIAVKRLAQMQLEFK